MVILGYRWLWWVIDGYSMFYMVIAGFRWLEQVIIC